MVEYLVHRRDRAVVAVHACRPGLRDERDFWWFFYGCEGPCFGETVEEIMATPALEQCVWSLGRFGLIPAEVVRTNVNWIEILFEDGEQRTVLPEECFFDVAGGRWIWCGDKSLEEVLSELQSVGGV